MKKTIFSAISEVELNCGWLSNSVTDWGAHACSVLVAAFCGDKLF